MSVDPILLVNRNGRPSLYSAGRWGARGDGVTDDTAAFVSAANYAQSQGVNFVVAPAGTYHCPGMDSDDMGGLYIVGDGVSFTSTTYVAAFSIEQWAQLNRDTKGNVAPTHGMISFEMDGPYTNEWTTLFPFFKSLGITAGCAISNEAVTAVGGAPWLKEMYRHGWEILSHSDTHADFRTLSEAEIRTECENSLTLISSITGTSENIGFVYPYHYRNEATDDVCRCYFLNGRAGGSLETIDVDAPQNWVVQSALLDDILATGAMSDDVRYVLDSVARGNRKLRFYFHATSAYAADLEDYHAALTEIVEYARSIGIQIVNPTTNHHSWQMLPDPYFDRTDWSTANVTRDTTVKYHGSASYKMDSATPIYSRISTPCKVDIARPGLFAVVKASFRYKCASDVTFAAGYGIFWSCTAYQRVINSVTQEVAAGGSDLKMSHPWPNSGTTITAGDWEKVECLLLVPANMGSLTVNLRLNNITPNPALYIDELRWDVVDYISCRKIETTLNGTTGRSLYVGCHPSMCSVTVVPKATLAGRIYVTDSADYITIYSTDAADSGDIDVLIKPLESYQSLPELDSQVLL